MVINLSDAGNASLQVKGTQLKDAEVWLLAHQSAKTWACKQFQKMVRYSCQPSRLRFM
jgi:hypothetical protein